MLNVQQPSAAYERFTQWAHGQDPNAGKSSLWQLLSREFDGRHSVSAQRSDLFSPGGFLSYSFFDARHEGFGFTATRLALHTTYWVARAANLLRARAWRLNLEGAGELQLAHYPMTLRALEELKLLDGYTEFCARFHFSRYSYTGAKAYYLARTIAPYLARDGGRVIEIGAGMANLAIAIHHLRPVKQYVIVDLPEMLMQSALMLGTCYPDVPVHFLYPGSPDSYDDRAGFFFCEPGSTDQLTGSVFDFGCNIDSFQEMTQQQIATYLAELQRVIKPGGHLVTMNRRKYLDTERFDNNPLTYPYDRANAVLVWETDPFMHRVCNYAYLRKDGYTLRIERVEKDS